jgi:hypothetical protein
LFTIMHADNSFCERILKRWKQNNACFMSLSNFHIQTHSWNFLFLYAKNNRSIIVLSGRLRNIYLRAVHMKTPQYKKETNFRGRIFIGFGNHPFMRFLTENELDSRK